MLLQMLGNRPFVGGTMLQLPVEACDQWYWMLLSTICSPGRTPSLHADSSAD